MSEFDRYSDSYDNLLKDPVRDRFMGGDSQFFHVRKRDLIRAYFRKRSLNTGEMDYLDLGCGKGELALLLRQDFKRTFGCDVSEGMLQCAQKIETRVQTDPGVIPFADHSFDFVTAVCVYHHVPLEARAKLTAEVRRVLRPNGIFALIEHNPYNPITRAIVKRTPVDEGAILLRPRETKSLLKSGAFQIQNVQFFLYLPAKFHDTFARLEALASGLPLGGQYAIFSERRPD